MTDVVVRHVEPSDYEALHRILTGPKAAEGTLQLPLQSAERWRKRLAEPDPNLYSLVACVDSEVVGSLALHTTPNPRRRHVAELGMSVRDDWQGRGVGSALMHAALDLADNWLDLRRVELQVYTDNAAGIALYQKFGFAIEGTLVAYAFRKGEYVDAYSMARVRLR